MAAEDPLFSMSKADEDALVERARKGDRRAMDTLYRKNRRLIAQIVRSCAPRGTSDEFIEDLVQEGALGMMRAVPKYDASRGFKFTTYAMWWVKAGVMLALNRERGRGVRTTTSWQARKVASQAMVVKARAVAAFGEISDEDVARMLNIDVEELMAARTTAHIGQSEPFHDENPLQVPDESCPLEDDIIDQIDAPNIAAQLQEMLEELPPRHRLVLERRYMVDGKRVRLTSIGEMIGVSRERARQIDHAARDTMRKLAAEYRLEDDE